MDTLNKLLSERNAYICNGDNNYNNNNYNELKWIIKQSNFGGRGLFAARDITAGEIIFTDIPSVLGPRTNEQTPGCSVCLTGGRALTACPKGCGLPVCHGRQCFETPSHREDCKLLKNLAGDKQIEAGQWFPHLYKGLTLLRCLNMNEKEREIIKLLHGNKANNNINIQISQLKQSMPNGLTEEDEQWLTHCCGILDGTSFEVPLTKIDGSSTVRGLYPLAAMMNHCCSPNVRQNYSIGFNIEEVGNGPQMKVTACYDIPENTELTITYCPQLWATSARRQFLLMTKQFQCSCFRCSDPTEFGTYLSAIKCSCGKGILLPIRPLNMISPWQCNSCSEMIDAKKVLIIQTAASQMDMKNLCSLLPCTNYIIVQSKLESVWKNEKLLSNLTDDQLAENKNNINDLLEILQRLGLNKSRMSGMLLMELYKTGVEISKKSTNGNPPITDELKKLLAEANKIVDGDFLTGKI